MIHPADEYVGMRLRERRLSLGLSQEEIGISTGITFQQVQKYEKGLNRIAISRLYEFSKILQVSVGWFLEGFGDDPENDYVMEQADSKETLALVRTYFSTPPIIRKRILSLLKSVSQLKSDNFEDTEE